MDRHNEQAIKTCFMCQGVDKSTSPVVPPLQPVEFPSVPWKKLAIDFVGLSASTTQDRQFAATLEYFIK